jgi:hypothetical protein
VRRICHHAADQLRDAISWCRSPPRRRSARQFRRQMFRGSIARSSLPLLATD